MDIPQLPGYYFCNVCRQKFSHDEVKEIECGGICSFADWEGINLIQTKGNER